MNRLRFLIRKGWRVTPGGALHRAHEALGRVCRAWPWPLGGRWTYRLFLATRPYTVVCQRCDAAFQSVVGVGNGTQGNTCASSCEDGRVFCHYGSHLDGHVYVDDSKALLDWDPVCDACIHALETQRALRHVGDYVGLGPHYEDWGALRRSPE